MLSKLLSTKRYQNGGGSKNAPNFTKYKNVKKLGGLKMIPKLGGFEALWVRHGTEKAREDGVQMVTTNVATGSRFQPLQPSIPEPSSAIMWWCVGYDSYSLPRRQSVERDRAMSQGNSFYFYPPLLDPESPTSYASEDGAGVRHGSSRSMKQAKKKGLKKRPAAAKDSPAVVSTRRVTLPITNTLNKKPASSKPSAKKPASSKPSAKKKPASSKTPRTSRTSS